MEVTVFTAKCSREHGAMERSRLDGQLVGEMSRSAKDNSNVDDV